MIWASKHLSNKSYAPVDWYAWINEFFLSLVDYTWDL